jgi:hypothetical protein
MIRFLVRFAGLLLLALAFIFVIYDGMKSIAGGEISLFKFIEFWSYIHASSLQALQTAIERSAGAEAWRLGVVFVLDQPASIVFAILGAILIVLGRKKKPLIGYARD